MTCNGLYGIKPNQTNKQTITSFVVTLKNLIERYIKKIVKNSNLNYCLLLFMYKKDRNKSFRTQKKRKKKQRKKERKKERKKALQKK